MLKTVTNSTMLILCQEQENTEGACMCVSMYVCLCKEEMSRDLGTGWLKAPVNVFQNP